MRYKSNFKHDYETIFDFELPDDIENYSRWSLFIKWDKEGIDIFRKEDTANWHLGLYFSGYVKDKEKAEYYWNKMKDKSLLRLLWQDFP